MMSNTIRSSLFLSILTTAVMFTAACSFAPKVGLGSPEGPLKEHTVAGKGGKRIAVVDITGVIELSSQSMALIGPQPEGMLARLDSELKMVAKDKRVVAVIVRIDSPGGGVTASDMIYERIMRFRRETKLPVIALMMQIAASGGYYVALAADEIIAHPTTITGSIGVIMSGLNFTGLLERLGIEDQTIKAGAVKDIGSTTRKMTDEERVLLEEMVNAGRAIFIDRITASRKLPRPDVEKIADGRILTAAGAKEAKLIDGIGYHSDAFAAVHKRTGLAETDTRVVIYRREGEPSENVFSLRPGGMAMAGASAIGSPWAGLAAMQQLQGVGLSLAIPVGPVDKDAPNTK